jgi:hypothetical protein
LPLFLEKSGAKKLAATEKNTLLLAFLRPGYSDIFKITAKGRASFRRMRNGEGERLGRYTFLASIFENLYKLRHCKKADSFGFFLRKEQNVI